MKKYDAAIISMDYLQEKFGETMLFSNGFYNENVTETDFWNELELILNQPIVSIRPSGRESWNEIIVLMAKGWIDKEDQRRVLDYSEQGELEDVLIDIFDEWSIDEYEVFEHFKSTCSKEVWDAVDEWVHTTW